MSKKVAVILSGSGGMDGSESHEAICSLLAIEKEGFVWSAYALNENQKKVVSHCNQQELSEERNMLAEAGRLVHGKIRDLDTKKPESHDVLWFIGGYGVVSSLSNLQEKGAEGIVHPKIEKLIHSFYGANKPIVGLCIAPTLFARSLFDKKLMITLGKGDDFDKVLQQAGHILKKVDSDEFVFDQKNNIYTTPAYMNSDGSALKILIACEKIMSKIAEELKVKSP